MKIPSKLKPGDAVEVIAPASRCTTDVLDELKKLLLSWQLNCTISPELFGDDLLCANTDEMRFKSLQNALANPETKAIICARGGYGSMRLIPELTKLKPPSTPKWLVGMSDITALHLFMAQHWNWITLHGSLNTHIHSAESVSLTKSLLFGERDRIELVGTPLNRFAEQNTRIEANLTGGNLCLVQTSVGTNWQLNGKNKIIFLEEVGERGYRIDRMLAHLHQASICQDAKAIIFGDFLEGNEPDGSSLVLPVLKRFAAHCPIPVVQIAGIGHGHVNSPLLLGAVVQLQLGAACQLIWV